MSLRLLTLGATLMLISACATNDPDSQDADAVDQAASRSSARLLTYQDNGLHLDAAFSNVLIVNEAGYAERASARSRYPFDAEDAVEVTERVARSTVGGASLFPTDNNASMNFPSARQLDDDDLELVALATTTVDANTDATSADADGIHTVGAAVMAGDYRKFAGVNLYHFTGGPCAELVALGAARVNGAREIVTIVAVGNGGRGVLAPRGRDRQVLADYHPTCRVIIPTTQGPRSVLAAELLPGAYQWPDAVARPDERRELLFSARYLDAVRSGAKTRTTRRTLEAAPGPIRLVFPTDPRTRFDGTVTSVRQTTLADLTTDDARAEQCQTPEDLRSLLEQHYPGIAAEAQVWVHEFFIEPQPRGSPN